MKFDKLEKPMSGIEFWLGNVLFNFNFAKTFTWAEQNDDGTERKILFLNFSMIKRYYGDNLIRAFCFVLGPFKIMIVK